MVNWLETVFGVVLNMSIAAAVTVLAVLLVRLLLRRAPKAFSYALWIVVLFRLLCPVSVAAPLSLLGMLDAPAQVNSSHTTVVEYVAPLAPPTNIAAPPVAPAAPVATPVPAVESGAVSEQVVVSGLEPMQIAAIVWALGVVVMLIFGVASYLRLRRRLVGYVPLEGNIRLADGANSPFVLGIIRPKIYLPSDLDEHERAYVIEHERCHIRRGDHIFKALGFIALCLHWFDPFVWLAFVLSGRDMEMSCDEAVLRRLGEDVRADYSQSLLRFAAGRRITLAPLAFGESDTGGRIRNLLRWRRPRAWISGAAALICVVALAACAVNPSADDLQPGEYGTAEDIGYYIELAAGTEGVEFRDMDRQILQQIVDAHPSMDDGEAVLARMSTDGRSAYVFWRDNGGSESFTEVESTAIIPRTTLLQPDGGEGDIALVRLTTSNGMALFFEPEAMRYAGLRGVYESVYRRYGPEYITDALARGIALYYTDQQSGVSVIYTNERFGGLTELIPLGDEEAEALLTDERMTVYAGAEPIVGALSLRGELSDIYSEDTGIASGARELMISHCGYDPCGSAAATEPAQGAYGTAGDLAYYLEYADGGEFHDMDSARRDEILSEYGELLSDYSFIARENSDGEGYILGQYIGDPAGSPLSGMLTMEFDGTTQILYSAEDQGRVQAATLEGRVPDGTIAPELSQIYWYFNASLVQIAPEQCVKFGSTLDAYLYMQDGREYIVDAVSRGIDVSGKAGEPYLKVHIMNRYAGEISERIPLTEAEAAAMLAEERVPVEGFAATLYYGGESTLFGYGFDDVPRSALELAKERCGWEYGSTADIDSDIVAAQLDWVGETMYADESDLPLLREILLRADKSIIGACGYGARLTLTLESGKQVTAWKGVDSCGTIAFGSYNGYSMSIADNKEFWSIFGLGALANSEPVQLDDGNVAQVAASIPASVVVDVYDENEQYTGSPSGVVFGLDESYDLAYSGGTYGVFGAQGRFLALYGYPALGSAPLSLFVSSDGSTWHTFGDPYRLGVYYGLVTGVGFAGANTAYICYRPYEDAGPVIYRTTDGGESWLRLETGLPREYISDRERWTFTALSPEFDGAQVKIPVIVLDNDTGTSETVALVSNDAGASWTWD